jgi:hypothetical protein
MTRIPQCTCTRWLSTDKGVLIMENKEEIIFFDELGFGWLLDANMLRRIRDKESNAQILIQRSLAELFRTRKLL